MKFLMRVCPVSYTHLDVYKRQSLPATFYVLTRVFPMATDYSRKFKQNQKIICIQPYIVEFSRPVVFGEDRLRERGSLLAFYVLKGYFLWQTIRAANSNRIK